MSSQTASKRSLNLLFLVSVCLLLLGNLVEHAFGDEFNESDTVPLLPVNKTVTQDFGIEGKELYAVHLPDPGFVALYAAALDDSSAATPNVFLVDPGTGRQIRSHRAFRGMASVLKEIPNGLLLRVEKASDLWVGVAPQDPGSESAEHRIQVRYLKDSLMVPVFDLESVEVCEEGASGDGAGETSGESLPIDGPFSDPSTVPAPLKDVEPEECDILDGLLSGPGGLVVESSAGFSWIPSDADSTALARLLIHELESPEQTPVFRVTRLDICNLDFQDDHADDFFCASQLPLSTWLSGELGKGKDVDEDHFAFSMPFQSTVEIEVIGAHRATLVDKNGQRLMSRNATEPGDRLSMVRTLGRGRHHVVVTGRPNEDAQYSLRIRELDPR